MKSSTQIEISAQVWVCDVCHAHDRKSCGCVGAKATASVEERARKTVETLERRDRKEKAKQNQGPDPRIEKTRESGNGSTVEKPTESAKPTKPPTTGLNELNRAWMAASPDARHYFVRDRWDQIQLAREQIEDCGVEEETRTTIQ
jgi:hypothetical protein